MDTATLHQVDRADRNGHFYPVAWFLTQDDAAEYILEFATDPLNTGFSYRHIRPAS